MAKDIFPQRESEFTQEPPLEAERADVFGVSERVLASSALRARLRARLLENLRTTVSVGTMGNPYEDISELINRTNKTETEYESKVIPNNILNTNNSNAATDEQLEALRRKLSEPIAPPRDTPAFTGSAFRRIFDGMPQKSSLNDIISPTILPVQRNFLTQLDDTEQFPIDAGDPVIDLDKRPRRYSETELQAHHFRATRLKRLRKTLRKVRRMDNPTEMAGEFAAARQDIIGKTQEKGSIHRELAPFIAAMMSTPESRGVFMASIDKSAKKESDELKERAREGQLSADVVIVGAGVQGSILAARLRADSPTMNVIAVDTNPQLGGQFRSYGDRSVFYINSRNFRPQNNELAGLPGQEGNLNSFGPKAPVQVTDFSTETYPTNNDLGDTAALNQFFSAPTMLGVEMFDTYQKDLKGEIVFLRDSQTGEEYSVDTDLLVVIPGAGEREATGVHGNLLTAQELFTHFADPTNKFPMRRFKDKRIAIKGAGDTGRVVAELFARLAPKEAYGNSTVQMGGPKAIMWYGTDFEDRAGFCDTNRSRYRQLSSFIANKGDAAGETLAIFPKPIKVEDVQEFPQGTYVTDTNGVTAFYDMVIDCSALDSTIPEVLYTGEEPEPMYGRIDGVSGPTIVGQTLGNNVIIAGPAAKSPLSEAEQGTFAKGIKENTTSIWANGTRTNSIAASVAASFNFKRF